jgi:hypothetical protein
VSDGVVDNCLLSVGCALQRLWKLKWDNSFKEVLEGVGGWFAHVFAFAHALAVLFMWCSVPWPVPSLLGLVQWLKLCWRRCLLRSLMHGVPVLMGGQH